VDPQNVNRELRVKIQASGSLQDSIGFYDRHSRLQGAGWPHVYQK
jgi:hypothetical protein